MNIPCRHALAGAAVIFGGLVLSACHHPPEPRSASFAPVERAAGGVPKRRDIVHIGDVLDVVVMEDRSLGGQFPVLESGNIILPGIGRIYLAGSTLEAAQDIVRHHIESDQVKKATVIVERVRNSQQVALADIPKMLIFVSGAVARPGQHWVPLQSEGGLSAFEVLMIAGGTTRFGDLKRSYILRKKGGGERERMPVDLRAISQGEARDIQLQEGDVIMVPQRRFGL